jgi:hypothetical protein
MYVAGHGGPLRAELFEHDLGTDTNVFMNLGEREIGLALAGSLIFTQAGTADLGNVAQNLTERVGFGSPLDYARRRRTDAAQKPLTPQR